MTFNVCPARIRVYDCEDVRVFMRNVTRTITVAAALTLANLSAASAVFSRLNAAPTDAV